MKALIYYAACVAALTLSVLPSSVGAQAPSHVRFFDPSLKVRFDSGLKRSPTLRQLLDQLEGEPVLVFVGCARYLPMQIGAHLNLISSVNGVRYVRVEMNCTFSERLQIALLAHELQHAVEIASRVDIVDVDAMQAYYEEFGFQSRRDGGHASYETDAAIAIQRRVMIETGRSASTY